MGPIRLPIRGIPKEYDWTIIKLTIYKYKQEIFTEKGKVYSKSSEIWESIGNEANIPPATLYNLYFV